MGRPIVSYVVVEQEEIMHIMWLQNEMIRQQDNQGSVEKVTNKIVETTSHIKGGMSLSSSRSVARMHAWIMWCWQLFKANQRVEGLLTPCQVEISKVAYP